MLQLATELKRFKWMSIPEEGGSNTGNGLLNWDNIFDELVAPSVFHKDRWVSRKMIANKLASSLDFLNTRVDVMTDLELQRLIKVELPGQILVAGLEQLQVMNEEQACPSPLDYQENAWIGVMPYFDKEPPQNQDMQSEYQDEVVKKLVKDKLQNVID